MIANLQPTNEIKVALGIQKGGPIHAFFTDECARYMDPFVPFRTGALAETVVKDGIINRDNVYVDRIIYKQDYAKYVYNGISKNGNSLNYRKDMHSQAGPYWDERMWSAYSYEITRNVVKYQERGDY